MIANKAAAQSVSYGGGGLRRVFLGGAGSRGRPRVGPPAPPPAPRAGLRPGRRPGAAGGGRRRRPPGAGGRRPGVAVDRRWRHSPASPQGMSAAAGEGSHEVCRYPRAWQSSGSRVSKANTRSYHGKQDRRTVADGRERDGCAKSAWRHDASNEQTMVAGQHPDRC